MIKPKAYPPNDSTEQDAKTILETLVDSNFVKLDIRTRDKFPNVDGTLELVNEKSIPAGKFDVQLRTIPKGHESYNCETSLVEYSKVSLPILLVCVDIENKLAFWKHINPYMPEYQNKQVQQSFVIHFSKSSDTINPNDRIYIHQWRSIAEDYRKCMAQYPSIHSGLGYKLDFKGVKPRDRELFQIFIDTINNLLDNDFIVIKELLFPGIWKLGVGILYSDQTHVNYQLYRIPYQEPLPLVCELSHSILSELESNPDTIEIVLSHHHHWDPIEAGREFVLEKVSNVIKAKSLPVYGLHLSSDILFSFVDLYYPSLNVKPELDRYSIQELSFALNKHLINTGAKFLGNADTYDSSGLVVDLDWLSNYIVTNKSKPGKTSDATVYFSFGSKIFPVKAAFDSLKYLVANGAIEINRSFGKRDLRLQPGTHYIWSDYSSQNEINSVVKELQNSIDGYQIFVRGNKLKLPNSPYLDPNMAIIYEYLPVATNKFEGPGLNEFHIENIHHDLRKLSVFIEDQGISHVDSNGPPRIKINNNIYDTIHSSIMTADFFFQRTPFLNLIYKMIVADLSKHYGINIIHF